MNRKEISDFLNRVNPPLLGVLGTINSKGFPHLVPVWYQYSNDVVNIWTTLERAWPRMIRNNPCVSLSVQETEPPFAAVVLKGTATIVVNGPDHWNQVWKICARYIPPDELEAYIEPWHMLESMCVIRPNSFVTWKKGY